MLRAPRLRPLALSFALALTAALAAPASASPSSDFAALIADHWRWTLAESPEFASRVGVHDHDGDLDDMSLAAADRRAAQAAVFLRRLDAIPDAGLAAADRTNRAILRRLLAEQVEANRFGQRTILFTSYYSPYQGFADLPQSLAFQRRADFENWLSRLVRFPAQNDQIIAVSAQAVRDGFTQPCDALDGFEGTISGAITPDPIRSRFYKPFLGARPADATDAQWADLKARAAAAIRRSVFPAYARFADFYLKQYKPRCATKPGASAEPNGAAYYAFRIRVETTTDYTPAQVHAIGLAEVARIGTEMDALAKRSGYASGPAMMTALNADPASYAKTPDALLADAALEAKTIDGKLPGYFGRLPRLPYGVTPVPDEIAATMPPAYYNPGSVANDTAGMLTVNLSKLDQRPLWQLPALVAHEGVPGHHLQLSLQKELDLPAFRRESAEFNAFVEGWALYSEHLGIEMGIYDTPAKRMGRLAFEMWRACRLVVDTGLHARGWSKAQAIAYLTEHSALPAATIATEVNRYISWPAQALGYKLGELAIEAQRARAEKALGPRFDLRGFNDAVIGQGAIPLDLLAPQIDAWIATRARNQAPSRPDLAG